MGVRGDYLFFPRLPTCDDLEAKDKPYRTWVSRWAASFSFSALSAFPFYHPPPPPQGRPERAANGPGNPECKFSNDRVFPRSPQTVFTWPFSATQPYRILFYLLECEGRRRASMGISPPTTYSPSGLDSVPQGRDNSTNLLYYSRWLLN